MLSYGQLLIMLVSLRNSSDIGYGYVAAILKERAF